MESPSETAKVIKDQLVDFCDHTSLHGVQYLGEVKRPRIERFLWLLALLMSFSICAWQMKEVWVKWQTSPLLVTPEMSSTPVWTEPFPAVTVCSQIKANRDVFNFTAAFRRSLSFDFTPKTEADHLHDMCLLCSLSKCTKVTSGTADEDSVSFLQEAAPPLKDVVAFTFWLDNDIVNGTSVFTPILTENGVCYTFNMLDVEELFTGEAVQGNRRYLKSTKQPKSEWTEEDGYGDGAGISTYPRRAILGSRDRSGLSITMISTTKDTDYLCTESEQGFKIYIHNPAEMPQARHHPFIHVDSNKQVAVSVLPGLITTSDIVKRYSPKKRQCYYASEKQLRFFGAYTQANCEMECLASLTLSACGCVPFYMPRSNETTICNLEKRQSCVKEYPLAKQFSAFKHDSRFKEKTNMAQPQLDDWVKKQTKTLPDDPFVCGCLPSCISLDYTVKTSSPRDFNWKEFIEAYPETFENYSENDVTMAKIEIALSNVEFVAKQRTELFGVTDALSSCGGLLGLGLGFSVLSLVEVIYFSTIRLYAQTRRAKRISSEMENQLQLNKL